jgi:hypothetical protein
MHDATKSYGEDDLERRRAQGRRDQKNHRERVPLDIRQLRNRVDRSLSRLRRRATGECFVPQQNQQILTATDSILETLPEGGDAQQAFFHDRIADGRKLIYYGRENEALVQIPAIWWALERTLPNSFGRRAQHYCADLIRDAGLESRMANINHLVTMAQQSAQQWLEGGETLNVALALHSKGLLLRSAGAIHSSPQELYWGRKAAQAADEIIKIHHPYDDAATEIQFEAAHLRFRILADPINVPELTDLEEAKKELDLMRRLGEQLEDLGAKVDLNIADSMWCFWPNKLEEARHYLEDAQRIYDSNLEKRSPYTKHRLIIQRAFVARKANDEQALLHLTSAFKEEWKLHPQVYFRAGFGRAVACLPHQPHPERAPYNADRTSRFYFLPQFFRL